MVTETQDIHSIYVGDAQIRTPQDQGPMQNAAVDKGAFPTAMRSLYTDATSTPYFSAVLKQAYVDLLQEDPAHPPHFAGLFGTGDYLDLACQQEMNLFRTAVEEMRQASPELAFHLLARGNHDGGQYMGTVWSSKNFGGLLRWIYPRMVLDARTGACGEQETIEEVREAARDFDEILRRDAVQSVPFEKFISETRKGGRKRFENQKGDRFRFADHDQAFAYLWKETVRQERWDALIHYDKKTYAEILADEQHDQEKKDDDIPLTKNMRRFFGPEFATRRGDVKQWIHLQAYKVAEFQTDTAGVTVPVYQIALDTQDYTSFSSFEASVKGHVSAFQVSVVEAFIVRMLRENPNAKFKLVMHYPVEELVCRSRRQLKRLLSREEVILVVDAHLHKRQFNADISFSLGLKRKHPLPRITVPSATDEPREVVREKMSFQQQGGLSQIEFEFTHHRIEEDHLMDPVVEKAVAKFESKVVARKLSYYKTLQEKGVNTDALMDQQGRPRWIYLNQDEIIVQLKDPFLKKIAGGLTDRQLNVWQAFRIYWRLGGNAMSRLITEVSIAQTQLDFNFFMVFLESLADLLRTDEAEKSRELDQHITGMKEYYRVWSKDYQRRQQQEYPVNALQIYNNLYTSADLQRVYDFLNHEIEPDSPAERFALIAGMRASQEEARYHDYPDDPKGGAPDQVKVVLSYDLE